MKVPEPAKNADGLTQRTRPRVHLTKPFERIREAVKTGTLLEQIKELAKFTVAGWLAILTDFGVYNGLLLAFPPWVSKGISFTCGGAVAYLLNKYWTFRQKRRSYVEIVKFVVINGSGLGMNIGVNELVLRWSGGNTVLAFAAAVALSGSYIYLGQKFWVFRKKKRNKKRSLDMQRSDEAIKKDFVDQLAIGEL